MTPLPLLIALPLVQIGIPGPCEMQELLPLEAEEDSTFGMTTAIDGTTAAISGAGYVWVYELIGLNWFLTQRIDDPTDAEAFFGGGLALEGDRLMVGDPFVGGLPSTQALVYAYERNNGFWSLAQQVSPSGSPLGGGFGDEIVLQGDRMAVSAWRTNSVTGAIYVLEHDGTAWVETAVITQPLALTGDAFGVEIAMDGNRIAACMEGPRLPSFFWTGQVFIYEESDGVWTETAEVISPFLSLYDGFGSGLALQDDLLAVGSNHANSAVFSDRGRVDLFEWDGFTWVATEILAPSELGGSDLFGADIAIDDSLLVVGAPGLFGFGRGAVLAYEDSGTSWEQVFSSANTDSGVGDQYGISMALDAGLLIVGAPSTDQGTEADVGRAISFSLDGSACPSLVQPVDSLSLAHGGSLGLHIGAGVQFAHDFYAFGGSFSGTDPGISVGSGRLPLNPDSYFTLIVSGGAASPLFGGVGVLGSFGNGQAKISIPPNSDPSLVGTTVNHAFIAFETNPFQVSHISNATETLLVQ